MDSNTNKCVQEQCTDADKNPIENCSKCDFNSSSCNSCKDGYHALNDGSICLTGDCKTKDYPIEHCKICNGMDRCEKCEDGYTFFYKANSCMERNCLQGYYKIEHCTNCVDDIVCWRCEEGYARMGEFHCTNCLFGDFKVNDCSKCDENDVKMLQL